MKTNTLIQLPKFNYTSLDFETIVADIKQIIEEHPEYNTNWNDFVETDAGRILIELVSFVMEKFSSRLDWVARELFIGTATQRQSQINILQLINYRPKFPTPAFVNVTATLTKWVLSFDFPPLFTLTATDTTGALTQFELLKIADDGKPDYNYIYRCNTGSEEDKIKEFKNIPFYQGRMHIDTELYTDGVSNESFDISGYPVLDKSIRVYSETTGKECVEVDSFISPEAQQPDVPLSQKRIPYMVKIDASNKAKVVFGNDAIVDIPNKNEKFKIYYRTGGGASTNIVKGGISSTKTLSSGTDRVTIIFNNDEKGFGGSGGENIEEAKLTAPLSLRSANKTVTNEDYVIHLENINIVKRAKIISKENEPDDIFKDLGYRFPPLETWIYVVPDRSGLTELDPLALNKTLQISKNYKENGVIGYENIELTSAMQSVMVKNLRYYKYHAKCLISNATGIDTVYYENVDFTIDYLTEEIIRISTLDGGTIATDDNYLKLLYLYNETPDDFVNKCKRTFVEGKAILGNNAAVELYPGFVVTVWNANMTVKYSPNVDYKLNYSTNILELPEHSAIGLNDTVIVSYADEYDALARSEEKVILDDLKNKKMLCVDNHIKPTKFNTYDLVGTVYCYKSLRGQVQDTMAAKLRGLLNIENAKYDHPISKSEIMNHIMNTEGVRYVDIEYLGRNYYIYRKVTRDGYGEELIYDYSASPVDHKLAPRYNEIYVIADDEWEGPDQNLQNQRHGIILKFAEA